MNIIDHFKKIEIRTGISFSDSFYEFMEYFIEIHNSKKFNTLFKNYHFCNESEITSSTNEFIPDGFFPFFIEKNNTHEDFYCFENNSNIKNNKIIVFSRDAVVFEWEKYQDFLTWIKNRKEK